ncbi:regulatory LuxR family protein [Lentzea atacamensis]|uniref:Regulatory LuxR family protein n=1 Tax=Lentzea atacamensis TaxID=531938 RepID=A0A316I0C3_9PSEU|nr:LuxR family transcriptional regulator [Lentzea atacamensis]PWK80802.1 regulatory LuxR family protein [Lentzea atacamensis]
MRSSWRSRATLVGREQEVSELCAGLRAVEAGCGDAVLLEGPAGIGKSRLLVEVCDLARRDGFHVLIARASAAERTFAFGVASQLLEPPLLSLPPARRDELLAGSAALASRVLNLAALGEGRAGQSLDTYAALHALYRLVAALSASQPVLVAVDDVEQADAPSLRWLAYLLRRLGSVRVAMVMTRCTGTESADPELLAEVTTALRRMSLCGLGLGDCARLIGDTFSGEVSEEFVAACRAATGGNPFLLNELVRGLVARDVSLAGAAAAEVRSFGPREVATAVLTRLRQQGVSLVPLAGAVAALGQAEPELAAAASGLELSEVVAGADVLVRIGVFRPGPQLAFAHSIVRSAVEQDPGAVDREVVHARAALFRHRRRAPAEQVASHVLRSPGLADGWVIDVLTEAARCAVARGAPEIAVSYLQRALRHQLPEATHVRLLLQLGMTEMQVDPRAAVDHLGEAHRRAADPTTEAHVAVVLAQELGEQERYGEAMRILDRAAAAVAPVDPELAQRVELHILCLTLDERYTESNVSTRLAALRRRDGLSPSTTRFIAAITAFASVLGDRTIDETREPVMLAWQLRAHAESWQADQWNWTSTWEFGFVVLALVMTERLDLAEDYCSETLTAARERGMSMTAATAAALRAQVNLRRGRVAEAEVDARHALRVLDELAAGTRSGTIFALATLLEILMDRGDFGTAMRELTARGLDNDLPPVWRYNYLLVTRGLLRANLGDITGALADLSECGRRFHEGGMDDRAVLLWRSLSATLLDSIGNRAEALRLVREEVALARRWGAAGVLGFALRAAGLVQGGPEGMALLAESVAVLERSEFRLELARSLVEQGTALLRSGIRAEGLIHLRRACDIAGRHGADALVARIQEVLDSAGPAVSTDSGTLTPHELRIARMVIDGMTNKEVARTFEVTTRAIELHLTRIYRKLGIRGRSQLALALQRA